MLRFFWKNMMNNVIYQKCFDEISDLVSEKLNVSKELNVIPLESLVNMGSFKVIDHAFMKWMIERILAEDKNATLNGYSITELCNIREKLHFHDSFRQEYHAIRAARKMLDVTGLHQRIT